MKPSPNRGIPLLDRCEHERLLWRFIGIVGSRTFQRHASRLEAVARCPEHARSLLLILATEMGARPAHIRAIEWMAYWGLAVVGLGRFAPKTRGPMQMSSAPFKFAKAARVAARRVPSHATAYGALAQVWVGSEVLQPGQAVSPGEAMRLAASAVDGHIHRARRLNSRVAQEAAWTSD